MALDRFYGMAADEVARQEVDKDLFARAYAMALGDSDKTKAIYIGIRAERLEELASEFAAVEAKEAEEKRKRSAELTQHLATQPKSPPKPEDFSDPQVAEAVRAMLAALEIGGRR